ncbi:YEATS domain-containing protein 4 [Tyrophagus putrescentiae]|nr:YEATS domain-containing protein 4 [Tyrophagus putrescentiae]
MASSDGEHQGAAAAEGEEPVAHSHQWTVYLRPASNEDLEVLIERVEFRLHETFEQPVVTCRRMPYQFSTTGWGEFYINIRVYMRDRERTNGRFIPIEPPVFLKLFHYDLVEKAGASSSSGSGSGGILVPRLSAPGEVIVSEQYNELVIPAPSVGLAQAREWAVAHPRPDWTPPNVDWADEEVVQREALMAARRKIQEEIRQYRALLQEKIRLVEERKREMKKAAAHSGH